MARPHAFPMSGSPRSGGGCCKANADRAVPGERQEQSPSPADARRRRPERSDHPVSSGRPAVATMRTLTGRRDVKSPSFMTAKPEGQTANGRNCGRTTLPRRPDLAAMSSRQRPADSSPSVSELAQLGARPEYHQIVGMGVYAYLR